MAGCSKKTYITENLAVDALLEVRIRFVQNTSVAVYQCEDCGSWHLTSRGNMNPRLAEALETGEIKKQSQAYFWEKKLRH
jgi:hypothetical protein